MLELKYPAVPVYNYESDYDILHLQQPEGNQAGRQRWKNAPKKNLKNLLPRQNAQRISSATGQDFENCARRKTSA